MWLHIAFNLILSSNFSGKVSDNNIVVEKCLSILESGEKRAKKSGRRVDAPPGSILTSTPVKKWAEEKSAERKIGKRTASCDV